MADKKKVKKILYTIGTVILYIFMALCLIAVLLTVFSKQKEDGAVSVFGHEMRIVMSGSMEQNDLTDVSEFDIGSIPTKSLVVSENAPDFDEEGRDEWIESLKVGDVLVFRYFLGGGQETITHRIIDIEKATEGYKITLRGDNRTENEGVQVIYTKDDASPNYILGKVVYTSVVFGNILYVLRQPIGIALAVIVPAAIIIVLQIIRIINVFNSEKRKKSEAREAEQSSEIELLKKRLADLEQGKSDSDETPPESGSAPPMPEAESAGQEASAATQESTMSEGAAQNIIQDSTMSDDTAAQNSDLTGLTPAIETNKEVEQ